MFWRLVNKKDSKGIKESLDDLNRKYQGARNEQISLLSEKRKLEEKVRELENGMKTKVDECVALKVYLGEMEKVMPVGL